MSAKAKSETKAETPQRNYVFHTEDAAKKAAVEYSSTDISKKGKPIRWRVFKVEQKDGDLYYVVARSSNHAILTCNAYCGSLQVDSVKVPKVLPPEEYVKILTPTQFDELLSVIDEQRQAA